MIFTPHLAALPAARDSLRLREQGQFAGDAAHPLAEPTGVLSDAFGRVWVSDAALHKLRRWDAGGQPLDEIGALGSEAGQFVDPGAELTEPHVHRLGRVPGRPLVVLAHVEQEHPGRQGRRHHFRHGDGLIHLGHSSCG